MINLKSVQNFFLSHSKGEHKSVYYCILKNARMFFFARNLKGRWLRDSRTPALSSRPRRNGSSPNPRKAILMECILDNYHKILL